MTLYESVTILYPVYDVKDATQYFKTVLLQILYYTSSFNPSSRVALLVIAKNKLWGEKEYLNFKAYLAFRVVLLSCHYFMIKSHAYFIDLIA